jgi:hypothetical protein
VRLGLASRVAIVGTVPLGHRWIRPFGLVLISQFSDLIQIIANFKILYKFELKSENCERNFLE